MTDHDQDAAIGALTTRYSQAKRRRTALVAELQKVRESLDAAAKGLFPATGGNPFTAAQVPRAAKPYLNAEAVSTLLDELRTTCQELEQTTSC
jgi:hypothetical protein